MANPQITPGQSAIVGVSGVGASGPLTLGSLMAAIDNYAAAYVAKIQPDNAAPAYFNVVPKVVAAGATITVTISLTGTSADGTSLPAVTQQFDLIGVPEPPQATSIVVSTANVSMQFATASVDPGVPSVQLI